MAGYALIGEDGWVSGMVIAEAEFDSSQYPNQYAIEMPEQEARMLSKSYLHTFHDGTKFLQINDKKEIWKRIKICGIPDRMLQREMANHLENIIYPIASLQLPIPPVDQKQFSMIDLEVEILPKLKIVSCDQNDIETLEANMVTSGLYSSEDAWFQASQWILSKHTWAIKVEWQGNPIQIEIFSFDSDTRTLNGDFAVHIDRTRPLWFWRQMSKPVLRALYSHGFEQINSVVRSDKQEYAQFLSDAYGHEILKEIPAGFKMRLHIKDALTKIGKWPERRTMGAGWSWKKDNVTIREATQTDMMELTNAIDENWKSNPRKTMVLKRLNDSWKLDSAAILLAYENGKIINARLFRERNDPTVCLQLVPLRVTTNASNDTLPENQKIALNGFDSWCLAVGYKKVSFIMENNLFAVHSDPWLKRGWSIIKQSNNLTECERIPIGT